MSNDDHITQELKAVNEALDRYIFGETFLSKIFAWVGILAGIVLISIPVLFPLWVFWYVLKTIYSG